MKGTDQEAAGPDDMLWSFNNKDIAALDLARVKRCMHAKTCDAFFLLSGCSITTFFLFVPKIMYIFLAKI